MESAEARPEHTQPTAHSPLAAWWGHTGLLYTGLSGLAASAGSVVAMLFWDRNVRQEATTVSECVMASIQSNSIQGVAIAVAQWFILRRLIRRALRAASGRDLSQPELRIVRDTSLWIVMTVAGYVMGGALSGSVIGLMIHIHAYFGFPAAMVSGLISGFTIGLTQWLMLRAWTAHADTWIQVTMLGSIVGHLVQYIYWFRIFTPMALNISPFVQWRAQFTTIAVQALFLAAVQAVCLKRLAPGWMNRLHDAARAAPSDANAKPDFTREPR
jgi:hypothetical protein